MLRIIFMKTPQFLDCNIGPYVSDGIFQKSVAKPHKCVPRTHAGRAAQEHDHAYATSYSLGSYVDADIRFYQAMYGTNSFNTMLANAVKYLNPHNYGTVGRAKWLSHHNDRYSKQQRINNFKETENNDKTIMAKLRGTVATKKQQKQNKNQKNLKPQIKSNNQQQREAPKANPTKQRPAQTILAPVSVGSAMRGHPPAVSKISDGTRVVARDLISVLSPTTTSNMELVAAIELNPCYFSNIYMSNFAKMYTKFRFNKITAHFITDLPTSQQGTVIMTYRQNINDPHLAWSTNQFYQRVLTTPGSQIGSMWVNHAMTPKIDSTLKDVDIKSTLDCNDASSGAIFVYMKYDGNAAPGYIVLDYDISFTNMQQQARIATIPYVTGNWTRYSYNDNASPAIGTIVEVDCSTIAGLQNGQVWKIVLDVSKFVFGSGATKNLFMSRMSYGANTSIKQTEYLSDGYTLYGRVYNNHLLYYPTYKAAITQADASDCLVYASNYGSVTTHSFWALCLTTGYLDEQSN